MGGASKSPGRSSTNKSSAKGSGKGSGGSIAYPRKAAAIPKWTVTAYVPPRKISDKELEAARKVSGGREGGTNAQLQGLDGHFMAAAIPPRTIPTFKTLTPLNLLHNCVCAVMHADVFRT